MIDSIKIKSINMGDQRLVGNFGELHKCEIKEEDIIEFEMDKATGDTTFTVRPYRAGKAEFTLVYENGRDNISNNVKIVELGDEDFYIEAFIGHIVSGLSPGEDRIVNVSFLNTEIKDSFLEQIKEFGYIDNCEVSNYTLCGTQINII